VLVRLGDGGVGDRGDGGAPRLLNQLRVLLAVLFACRRVLADLFGTAQAQRRLCGARRLCEDGLGVVVVVGSLSSLPVSPTIATFSMTTSRICASERRVCSRNGKAMLS
jgi:hypothetical protein